MTKTKKLITMLALVLVFSLLAVGVSAHSFTVRDTNVQTKYYLDGVYQFSEYSWGSDDHPYVYIIDNGAISSSVRHEGLIPKVNVVASSEMGEIAPVGISTTIIEYEATYHGWLDCIYVPQIINN